MFWICLGIVGLTLQLPLLGVAAARAGSASGRSSLVWGLDLGNDNIVMAIASRNGVDVVTNDVSGRQTPSAIYFAGDHRLIGEHSAGHAGSNPRNLINHLKYLLQDRRSESSSMPTSFSPKPLHMADATTRRRGPSPRGSDRGSGGGGGGGGFEKTLPLPAVKQGSRDTGVGVQGKQTQLDSVDSGEEQDEDVPKQQQQQQQQPNTSGPPEVLVTSESERDNSNNIPRGRREGVPEDEKLDIISSSCSLSSITTAESMFFCKTRSPEDADHAGRVAVVKHMGEELELGASEAIAYLLGHCAEVVSREAGNRAAGGGGEVGVGETTAAAAVSSCVVASVPSHFTLRQRKAVLDAARIAGVPMPMVIDEGTAVALAYGILKGGLPAAGGGPSATVAFVDIGHSCTQVTVAAFTATGLRVLGRGCAAEGGGTAAGEAVVYGRICTTLSGQGLTVAGNARAEFRLAQAISSALKTLSANTEARLNVECIDGDQDLGMTLTREEVEDAYAGVAGEVVAACTEALRAAGIGATDVADVELLGGGSYIPLLRRAVEAVFGGDRVKRTMSSSESVARGCALAAAQHSSNFKLRPFSVTDSLPKSLRLVWRYRPRPTANSLASAEESTGEVDVPAGTAIPWSTSVTIDVGGGGSSQRGNKVHVHLMEGADRVASYQIDLGAAQGGIFAEQQQPGGGGGRGRGGEGNVHESDPKPKLKVLFHVDDAGVPSVQSARVEYEEQVTEFVEVPKPAPRRTPPSAPSASDRENYNSDSRGQKKASIEEKRKDGGESCTSSSSTGSASVDSAGIHSTGAGAGGTGSASAGSTTTGSASKPSPSPREGGETQEAVHGGGGGGGGGGSGEEGKNDAEGDAVEVESCAVGDNDGGGSEDVKPSDVDGIGKVDVAVGDEEERDACGSSPEQPENRDNGARERGEGKSTPSADKVETPRGEEQTPGGTGEEEEPKEEQGPMHEEAELRRADATVKVPHVVTRVRSRSLRVEQTYTGLLEGAALEEARARELALRAQDLSMRLSGEARNSLEDLIYATRFSLEPGDGELSPFAKPAEASAILSLLDETEEWLYASDGTRDKGAFEKRAASVRHKLSELQARRQARSSLLEALEEAEVQAAEGSAQLAAQRAHLSGSQKRHAESELAVSARFLSETRRKLDAAFQTEHSGSNHEYGSLVGRLPAQEADVRKRIESLSKAFAFARKEHS